MFIDFGGSFLNIEKACCFKKNDDKGYKIHALFSGKEFLDEEFKTIEERENRWEQIKMLIRISEDGKK